MFVLHSFYFVLPSQEIHSSPNRVDIVKPFVAAVAITIKQEQYATSYILISSDASLFFKDVRSTYLR